MATPPNRIIPRVALGSPSTLNPQHQRRLAFSRISNIITGLDVPDDVQGDNNNNNNNNNRTGRFRIFISVVNYNDRRPVGSAPVDPIVANTRRIERMSVNRSAPSRIRTRGGGTRGRSTRRPEIREQQEEEDDSDDEDSIQRRSSRRRGNCDHNHALEKSFCSKCHIRRRHLCRWWCRQQYRRQV